jgi:hypothetical protein
MAAAGEMTIGKGAGGEAALMAAAGNVAMHGGGLGDGNWESGGRQGS